MLLDESVASSRKIRAGCGSKQMHLSLQYIDPLAGFTSISRRGVQQ